MSAEAYIIGVPAGLSYCMGKFVGTWIDLDLAKCTVEEMQRRVRACWINLDDSGRMLAFTRNYDRVYYSVADIARRELYAADLGEVVWRFCERCGWGVEMVHEDELFDRNLELLAVGSRWPGHVFGCGFDLPRSADAYKLETHP